ncbi:Type II secretion system protein G precursor [Gemmata sp. SH-PL17]|uniref:prepilin-type N-terminal cleavage/methylation domain-containing protein n=1 Tax=Gemmata sp. SH-PL17 TaxID=1630693 RepID=UPI00078EBD28|nr:prepilin-type N-terminal cleavage/methylation domain-containing protein [Gemmata sp. SH-PL17]AMV29052.1 Type II secretion system protein G precursor [Gemmata sp. SH-PL17]
MMLVTTRRAAIRPASSRRRSAFTLIEVLVVVAILVILATIAAVAVPKQIDEAKKSKAQLGCVTISRAVEAYHMSTSNPNQGNDEGLPTSLNDLVAPPFGGPSFLPEGAASLKDPWNHDYGVEQRTRPDKTPFLLIVASAPDGTRISQYGVGLNAEPKNQ